MGAGDWFRALQVPVLSVGVGPVFVGTNLGAMDAGRLDPLAFFFSVASVLAIQIGANLQKGLVESRDLPEPPSRPHSMFAFDAGAVLRVGWERGSLEKLAIGAFGAGAGFGLAVVALRADPLLLVIGLLGAFFAYSYSGAPLKLSYRGIGEVSTFMAFGPLMLWGAYRAQTGWPVAALIGRHQSFITEQAAWLGIAFGLMAAMISLGRYFPAREEDERKGKQTPVVRWGPDVGLAMFVILWLALLWSLAAPFYTMPAYCPASGGGVPIYQPVPWLAVALPAGLAATILLRVRGGRWAGAGVGVIVLAHGLLALGMGQNFVGRCFL